MSCHGENKENNNRSLKDILNIVICCELPIVIIGFLVLISNLLLVLEEFIFLIMIFGMFGRILRDNKKKSYCNNYKNNIQSRDENRPIE